ncbi:hypothetical protein ENBRE01_3156 [Enteropsectra breve]|nr:hypothetical protein ENBRE01_3156 [Enteropsectra breve]
MRGKKPKFPVLEEQLKQWVLAERELELQISTTAIKIKALSLAQDMGILDFTASPVRINRFMSRNRLSVVQ